MIDNETQIQLEAQKRIDDLGFEVSHVAGIWNFYYRIDYF